MVQLYSRIPAMPKEKVFQEKRIHPRKKLNIPVKYRVIGDLKVNSNFAGQKAKDYSSQTNDLSLGGLYLVSDLGLDNGNFLRLEMTLPEYPNAISAYAEVVWSNDTGGGLHFEAIKEEDSDSLKNYLSKTS